MFLFLLNCYIFSIIFSMVSFKDMFLIWISLEYYQRLKKIIKYFFHPGSSNTDSLGAIKDVFYTFSIFNKHFT